ncbi:hypothetical protein, partial [Bradyrhizobium brasilense]|uniref:hypothetical protein n=1 Tax=Bradyrhizobium brasilense TaxID=1419277 RepID=UPI001E4EE721
MTRRRKFRTATHATLVRPRYPFVKGLVRTNTQDGLAGDSTGGRRDWLAAAARVRRRTDVMAANFLHMCRTCGIPARR